MDTRMLNMFLYDSDGTQKRITVNPYDCIQVLDSIVKEGGKRYILYKNQLIMTGFTFKFYGMKDGDKLFVVRTQKQLPNISTQNLTNIKLQTKQNEANRRFLITQNFSPDYNYPLVLELNRLVDQMFNKAEFKRITNPKFLKAFDEIYPKKQRKPNPVRLKFCPIDHPSTEELPVFWPQANTA